MIIHVLLYLSTKRNIRMTRSFLEILAIQSNTHSLTWKIRTNRVALLVADSTIARWGFYSVMRRGWSITSRVPQQFISSWKFLIALDFNYDFDHVALLLFCSIVDCSPLCKRLFNIDVYSDVFYYFRKRKSIISLSKINICACSKFYELFIILTRYLSFYSQLEKIEDNGWFY